MNYTQIIPYLVEAIKTLNTAVNTGVATGAQIGELIVHKLKAHEVETDVLCLTQVSGDRLCLTAEDVAHLGEEQNMVDTTTNEPIQTEDTVTDDTTVNQDTTVDEDTTLPEQTDEATTEEEPELTDPIENSVVTPPQIEESPVDDTAIELAPEPQGSV